MAPTLLRRARRGVLGATVAAAVLVHDAAPAAAHGVEGGALPAPPWLLGYIGVAVVAMTAVGLRASWPTARLARSEGPLDQSTSDATDGAPVAGPLVGQLLGLALLVLTFVAAIVGPDSAAANIVPVAVLVVWWVGLPLACVLAGDVMRAINPFQPVAALLGAPARTGRTAPVWTSAAFLLAFSWYLLAYHRPGSPRALVVLLAVYAVAALAGARWWGRSWLATGEGFGGLSAAVARVSLRRPRRPAPPGLAPLLIVWIGGTAFDAFAFTPFWADILGTSRGWTRTLVNSVGLVWITAIVAGLYLLVVRVAEHLAGARAARDSAAEAADDADDDPHAPPTPWPSLVAPLAVGLVPLATGWFLAHDLTLLLAQGQDFIALLSDPLGRGWDLFGTFNNTIDYTLVQAAWVGWVQLLALAAGHVAAVVLFHDAALRRLHRRDAVQATWVMAAVTAASIVAASLLVLS